MKKFQKGSVACAEHKYLSSLCWVLFSRGRMVLPGHWSVVVSAIQGHSAGSGEGGGTLAQKLAELCPPVSTQINVETGRKLK